MQGRRPGSFGTCGPTTSSQSGRTGATDCARAASRARPRTFEARVRALHEVSVDTWLSALPESVVKPEGRSRVVLAMLEGVPLPPRFDVAPLLRGEAGAAVDRYQLGAQVAGAVACAWLDRWVAARREGDHRSIRQAVEALATSHQWRVLHVMKAEGTYPRGLWQYADAVAADATIAAGKQLTVEESYRDALCQARLPAPGG